MAELINNSGRSIPTSDSTGRILNLMSVSVPMQTSHVYQAATDYKLVDGKLENFKDSTDYDVIVDGRRYPPKAIFGLALSSLLDADILPKHFAGGKSSDCFKVFKNLGFDTIAKENIEPRTKRQDESFEFSKFVVGASYTKLDAFKFGGVRVPNQARDIPGPSRFKNCVVLFVTLDKESKEDQHKYEDMFHLGGIMFNWESQNHNTPKTPHMQMIFNGEPVVLFARLHEKIKSKSQPFVYVGQLGYVKYSYPVDSKDIPVKVVFEVSDFQDPPSNSLADLYHWKPGLNFDTNPQLDVSSVVLTEASAPKSSMRPKTQKGKPQKKIKGKVNWAERDERNRNLGLAGEKLVIQFEKQKLIDLGLPELADKVEHIALNYPSAGYDIYSFDRHGIEKFIEVKTTEQSKGTAFFISRNEVEVSRDLREQYWVYRVYGLKSKVESVSFYSINGPVEDHFDLTPESYKARLK
ncbi:DUF3427 domain-containing protein [Moritella sp. 28]|uniref:DUF3427 domain-containing protein n=1 Tax=Moritella sp. 28 TaxID=2746232 RepID=UPI001BA47CFB|nr:DUF3427 domain-containing protein [Moritella sp. 28]QUM84611.1 DUF3427 domain-containing protein [Moritella sp. 28]